MLNRMVEDDSSKDLWSIETDSGKAVAYMLNAICNDIRELEINCITRSRVDDNEFAEISYGDVSDWGEPHCVLWSNDQKSLEGFGNRLNMKPIGTGRERKLICSTFIIPVASGGDAQVYMDNPRLVEVFGSTDSNFTVLQVEMEGD
ncbi:hypothetical protein [Gimesia aquarii]|uniref:Uncharacterized protein n=1 Tax=Gimesia aquarii TaxID=2527964 RepID=A0A517VZY5_9PLAN|nr:hypothetical protein [Gimesia aquarii]QDT98558.1 hypothetical protein V144x_40650 [Gimesia aquarii]